MRDKILKRLSDFESEYHVRVLYACESGSRAWGFESTDSDYDVRFIYAHYPDWYLQTKIGYSKFNDTINRMDKEDDLDFSGWDLKKSINLFKKGNPHLLEYLHSPVVYIDKLQVADYFRDQFDTFFSPKSSIYHYLHMAENNFNSYLCNDIVSYKKYLYVLRPLLCCQWIENKKKSPPVEFDILLDTFIKHSELRSKIDWLLHQKRSGKELDKSKRIDDLHTYLDVWIQYYNTHAGDVENEIIKQDRIDMYDNLDGFFRNTIFNS